MQGPSLPAALRSSARLFGLMLFVTYAYFVAAPSWNENSRFALTRSVVERGRLDIDPYTRETGDKSRRDGHHYSDKAPGASLLAVPVYGAYHAYLAATGAAAPASRVAPGASLADAPEDQDVQFNLSFRRALYFCNLFTNVLAGALMGVLYLHVIARLGVAGRRGLFGAVTLGLGSLVLPYSTMFYGHVLAAAFLFGSFALLARPDVPVDARRLRLAGLLAGAAVLSEFPCIVAVLALAGYALAQARQDRARVLLHFAVGGLVPAVVLLAYQWAAFGNPLRPGYALVSRPEFAEGMSQGLMGVGWPKLSVLGAELFGRARGLLYVAPVLVLGFVGLGRGLGRRSPWRPEALLCSGIVAYFLLLNAGYYMWTGGSALGPRHVIPALPFLCAGVPFAGGRSGGTGRAGWMARAGAVVAVIFLAVSALNQLAATAVTPAAPLVADVLRDHVYRHFLAGNVAIIPGATNLGMVMGLPGVWSLLPLLLLWFLAGRILLSSLPVANDAL